MKKWFQVKKLGQLYEEEVLVYGNEPVLFVCIDDNRQRYLSMPYDSYMLNYVIAAISEKDLIAMLENRISMDKAFRKNGIIYYTEENNSDESDELEVTAYAADQFPEDHLPDAGENYDLKFDWVDQYIKLLKKDDQQIHNMILNYQPFKESFDHISININYRVQRQKVLYTSSADRSWFISTNYRRPRIMQNVNNVSCFDERAV